MAKKKYTKKEKKTLYIILGVIVVFFIVAWIQTSGYHIDWSVFQKKEEVKEKIPLTTQQMLDTVEYYIDKQEFSLARAYLTKIDSSDVLFPEVPKYFKKIDSIKEVIILEKIEVRIQKTNNEISQISKFDNTLYRGSIVNLDAEITVFRIYAKKINELLASENAELIKLGKIYKSKILYLQTKEFPLMRKEYAKIIKNKLWEEDIDVYISGSRNTSINYTGGIFAANKNISDFQSGVSYMLRKLNFKRANYRWYKGETGYTYYTISSNKDNELVE